MKLERVENPDFIKAIKAFCFRSKTIEGKTAKLTVYVFENKTVIIQKRFFTADCIKAGFRLLRKGKRYFFYEEKIILKLESLKIILDNIFN